MKFELKTTVIAVLSVAAVLLSITTVYFFTMYASFRDSYVRVSLDATEYMLKVDKDFSDGRSEELKARIDATLDWYLTQVHALGQHPDLVSGDIRHFERVLKMAREAGYDLSEEELIGKRGEDYSYDLEP
jgi:hypothetical protein